MSHHEETHAFWIFFYATVLKFEIAQSSRKPLTKRPNFPTRRQNCHPVNISVEGMLLLDVPKTDKKSRFPRWQSLTVKKFITSSLISLYALGDKKYSVWGKTQNLGTVNCVIDFILIDDFIFQLRQFYTTKLQHQFGLYFGVNKFFLCQIFQQLVGHLQLCVLSF